MIMPYFPLFLMLVCAMGFIAMPYLLKQPAKQLLFSKPFWVIAFLMTVLSFGLYQITHDTQGLKQWLTSGKNHYELQEKIDQLGGIQGLITKVKLRLEVDPSDAQGWRILGKLYLAIQEDQKAENAFAHAKALETKSAP